MGMFTDLQELDEQQQKDPNKRQAAPIHSESGVIAVTDRPMTRPADRSVDRAVLRPTDASVGRRRTVRRSFEFYEDQLDILKRLSIDELENGDSGSMSRMVREAVDNWLSQHISEGRDDDR